MPIKLSSYTTWNTSETMPSVELCILFALQTLVTFDIDAATVYMFASSQTLTRTGTVWSQADIRICCLGIYSKPLYRK